MDEQSNQGQLNNVVQNVQQVLNDPNVRNVVQGAVGMINNAQQVQNNIQQNQAPSPQSGGYMQNTPPMGGGMQNTPPMSGRMHNTPQQGCMQQQTVNGSESQNQGNTYNNENNGVNGSRFQFNTNIFWFVGILIIIGLIIVGERIGVNADNWVYFLFGS